MREPLGGSRACAPWKFWNLDIIELSKGNSSLTYCKAPSTRIRIDLKTQPFLCGLAFRPHVSNDTDTENANFWKRYPEWKLLKTQTKRIRMDGKSRSFWKRWRRGSCPEHGAKQTRCHSIIVLSPNLASPVACLEIYLGILCVQAKYTRIKLNTIKAIFNASVEKICTAAFREARDRRKIDDFGFDLPGQLWWNNFRPSFPPKNVHVFSQLFTRCACSFATGYSWKLSLLPRKLLKSIPPKTAVSCTFRRLASVSGVSSSRILRTGGRRQLCG